MDDYLESYIFKPIFNEFNCEYKQPIVNISNGNDNNALGYLKSTYPDVINASENNSIKLCADNSIKLIKPFHNRELEWKYIVEQISNKIQKACGEDEDKIKKYLRNDIALVVTKGGYESRVPALLKEIGVFIFKGNT